MVCKEPKFDESNWISTSLFSFSLRFLPQIIKENPDTNTFRITFYKSYIHSLPNATHPRKKKT